MPARRALFRLAFALPLAACAPRAEQAGMAPATVDTAAVTAAVSVLWQRWITADTSGNVAALVALVSDSVRMDFRGMPPILSKEAWQAAAEAAFKGARYPTLTITPDMTVPVSNELVYQNGNYSETIVAGGQTMMDHGRYATAIRKDPDGQWRVLYFIGFADSTVQVRK